MKIFKSKLCVLCIITMCFLCSCGLLSPQSYICEIDNVESVQIITLDEYVYGEYRYEYTVLTQISNSDIANFIDRLHNVECSVNWGDPYQLNVGYTVIQICYKNGDFDFIHADAQWFNRSGVNEYGFFFFDDEQLEALISDYLP